MKANDIPEIANLSTPEKILLVEDIWDSIRSDENLIPVPQSHREELERRFERHQRNPGNLLSIEEFKMKIERNNSNARE